MTEHPSVYAVSDSIGETAESVVKAAISQYDAEKIEIRRVPNVSDTKTIDRVVEQARTNNSVIVYTLVMPELRDYLKGKALDEGVLSIDILSPVMAAIGEATGLTPHLEPGIQHKVDKGYFNRVEAIEFAVRYDDGKNPRGLLLADIVLIGVSRTSKTPLSMYLAHKGIKVANVPLVPEVNPPEELYQVERHRLMGLVVDPSQLLSIRKERLKTLGLMADANYANENRIVEEMGSAQKLMRSLGCPIIDVTNKAVEETASKILEIYYRGLSNV